MKLRSLSAAVITVALGAAGLGATAPAATAAGVTATSVKSASSNGTTVTVSTYDQLTGSTHEDLFPSVISVSVAVPAAYRYYSAYGAPRTAEVEWIATASSAGDPGCVLASRDSSGEGNGGANWTDVLYKDTDPGSCTVTVDVWATRRVEGHPAASYDANIRVQVPLKYVAQAFFTDVKTSRTSVTKGGIVTMSGILKYDDAYGLRSASVLGGAPLHVEETTSSPTNPAAKWRQVATIKTASTGAWNVRLKPSRSASYRVVYPGSSIYLGAKTSPSPIIRVTTPAATKLSTPQASPAKVKRGAYTTLSGKAYVKSGSKYKGYAKAKVTVQKKVGTKWKTVKTVTASKSGTWKLKIKATSTATYRTYIKQTSSTKSATSRSIKVTVRR